MDPVSKFLAAWKIPIGIWGKDFFNFLTDHFDTFFRGISSGLNAVLDGAVSGLLENRTKGVPLDDRELAHAYGILSSRAKLPSTMYAQFAIHALEHLGDEQLAGHYFARAVLANPRDEAFAARLYAELLAGGHARAAAQVLAAAQSVGILRMDDRRAPASGASPSASTRHAPSTGE